MRGTSTEGLPGIISGNSYNLIFQSFMVTIEQGRITIEGIWHTVDFINPYRRVTL